MMKKYLILFILTIITVTFHSQNTFDKGYFIDEENQKVDCFIKSVDWNINPTEFMYKLSDEGELKTATIQTVKEFGITDVSKYIRAKVNIDRSSEVLAHLSSHRNAEFKEEELFLTVLLEGKSNLYQYLDNSLKRFFFSTESSEFEQLVFKTYKKPSNKISENNYFRQQLMNNLKCDQINKVELERLQYRKNDLMRIFKKI